MLNDHASLHRAAAGQRGVVMIIALIVLVGLTLAGLALVRSVDTTNIIAGNMAFQQAALQAGDIGTETAVAWLEANNGGDTLYTRKLDNGYSAVRQDPGANQSWDNFWTTVLAPNGQVRVLPVDASTGNTVAYVIQRLCNSEGDPAAPSTGCAVVQGSASQSGNSKGSNEVPLQYNSAIFYRITTRIAGPRNAVSYVQTIVAL